MRSDKFEVISGSNNLCQGKASQVHPEKFIDLQGRERYEAARDYSDHDPIIQAKLADAQARAAEQEAKANLANSHDDSRQISEREGPTKSMAWEPKGRSDIAIKHGQQSHGGSVSSLPSHGIKGLEHMDKYVLAAQSSADQPARR